MKRFLTISSIRPNRDREKTFLIFTIGMTPTKIKIALGVIAEFLVNGEAISRAI